MAETCQLAEDHSPNWWQVYRRGPNLNQDETNTKNSEQSSHDEVKSFARYQFLFFCPVVNIVKLAKRVYTPSFVLKRTKIKYQTPCRCFSYTFVTRRVDEPPLISIGTQSRRIADLLSSQSYPTGNMLQSDVGGGLQVSVRDACTSYQGESEVSARRCVQGLFFILTGQSEPTEATGRLSEGSGNSDPAYSLHVMQAYFVLF